MSETSIYESVLASGIHNEDPRFNGEPTELGADDLKDTHQDISRWTLLRGDNFQSLSAKIAEVSQSLSQSEGQQIEILSKEKIKLEIQQASLLKMLWQERGVSEWAAYQNNQSFDDVNEAVNKIEAEIESNPIFVTDLVTGNDKRVLRNPI